MGRRRDLPVFTVATSRADFFDDADEFMADAGRAILGRHRVVGVQIAAADAGRGNSYQCVGGVFDAGVWTFSMRTSPAPYMRVARINVLLVRISSVGVRFGGGDQPAVYLPSAGPSPTKTAAVVSVLSTIRRRRFARCRVRGPRVLVVVLARCPGSLGGQFDDQVEIGGRDLRQFGQVEGNTEQGVNLHGPASQQVLARCFEDGWMSLVCSRPSPGEPGSQPRARAMVAPSVCHSAARPTPAGLVRTSFMGEAVSTPSEPPTRFITSFAQIASRIFGVTVTSRPPWGQQRGQLIEPVVMLGRQDVR